MRQSHERICALSDHTRSLPVANQMLSLVGSIQPDPFSPEHTPQAKPDREQSPQPTPHPILSEPIESEATGDEELDAATAQPSSAAEDRDELRGAKEGNDKKKREKEKTKRKRKGGEAVAKAERKPKRKKAS